MPDADHLPTQTEMGYATSKVQNEPMDKDMFVESVSHGDDTDGHGNHGFDNK